MLVWYTSLSYCDILIVAEQYLGSSVSNLSSEIKWHSFLKPKMSRKWQHRHCTKKLHANGRNQTKWQEWPNPSSKSRFHFLTKTAICEARRFVHWALLSKSSRARFFHQQNCQHVRAIPVLRSHHGRLPLLRDGQALVKCAASVFMASFTSRIFLGFLEMTDYPAKITLSYRNSQRVCTAFVPSIRLFIKSHLSSEKKSRVNDISIMTTTLVRGIAFRIPALMQR